jgi:hypothetical protein
MYFGEGAQVFSFHFVIELSFFIENIVCPLGTDRSRDFSAGPETAGSRFCFRLAGFCRTGTGCFEGKFSVCRTQPEIFTFCHEHMKILLLS